VSPLAPLLLRAFALAGAAIRWRWSANGWPAGKGRGFAASGAGFLAGVPVAGAVLVIGSGAAGRP